MTTSFKSGLTDKGGRPRVKDMAPSYTGIRLRELREARTWSLQKLSDEAEALTGQRVSCQAINAIELGGSQNPTRRILRPLARALGVSLSDLFESDEDEAPILMAAAG